jgi:TRAP-type C4-dicarboxylate transport system substrate-binding protein
MYTRRQLGVRLAALSTLATARGMPAWATEQTLRFGSISVAGSPTYAVGLEPYAHAIEQDSGGRLEVALKPAGGYGKPIELLPMVEKGEIEVAATVQGYYPGRFPHTSVIELPLIFDNSGVANRVMATLFSEGLLGKEYDSLKVLALYTSPPFGLLTTGKKVATLRDIRGLRVRSPGPTVGLALARLGAIPIGMPVSQMGDAIAKGIVDAIAFSMDSALGTKGAGDKFVAEQLSVAVDMRFAAPAQLVAMHQATWDALPPDLKAVIERSSAAFVADGGRWRDAAEEKARQKFQADSRYTYLPYSQHLHDELQEAMVPVYQDWKTDMAKQGIDGEHLLSRTRELVRQYAIASQG